MKKTLIISLIISSFFSYAQDKVKGIIYFRDGSKFEGYYNHKVYKNYGNALSEPKIIFSPSEDTQLIVGFNEIDKIKEYAPSIKKDKDTVDYYFKKYNKKALLLEKINTDGRLNLYVHYYRKVYTYIGANGFYYTNESKEIYADYYVGKKYSITIDKLPQNTTGRKFRKILLKYTSKCAEYVKKIKDYKFLSRNKPRGIILEYNKLCK